jgi:flagellar basal body-associated protein FliL
MAKNRQSDRFIIVILCSILACMVFGMAIAGFYLQYGLRLVSPVSYSSFGPVVVRGSQFSIKATMALETRNEDASWAENHQPELDAALQTALLNADPQRIRGPEGVTYVQGMLRDAANAALKTRNVQEVLLTNFIVQSN